MTYFTNVFVNAYDASDGTLYHYSLYSGETLREINEKIISIFEQTYDYLGNYGADHSALLNPDLTHTKLQENLQKILDKNKEEGYYRSAGINIGSPHTEIDFGLALYSDYLHSTRDEPWTTPVTFKCYGDVAKKISGVFPYCTALIDQYKLKITLEYMLKISDIKI